MTEISKMFENAGIKPLCQIPDEYCGMKNVYEDFTAEKQLAIEKVILTKRYRKISYYIIDNDYSATLYYDATNRDIPPYVTWSKTRDETFADIINYLWQSLTDQEKEEIRNILNA